MANRIFRIALIQNSAASSDASENVSRGLDCVSQAKEMGADFKCLEGEL